MGQKTFAGGSRFAHLLGRGKRSNASKAENDEEDEDARKAKKAEDGGGSTENDDDEDGGAEGKKASSGEGDSNGDDEDDRKAEDGGGSDDTDEDDDGVAKKAKGKKARAADDDDDDEARKAKRAKAEDGDDESDDKDEKDAKASAARARERARCAAIFASPAAAQRPDFAAHLAFTTRMNRGSAIAMLEAAATGEAEQASAPKPRGSLRQRMDRAPNPDVGADGARKPATGASGFAEEMRKANAIRHGEKI